jgi:hypothetical protein
MTSQGIIMHFFLKSDDWNKSYKLIIGRNSIFKEKLFLREAVD